LNRITKSKNSIKSMNRALDQKSTIGQIRERFDNDVERFSKLETGQQATIDAPLVLEIVAQTAATHLQPHCRLLDLGCGAGNFTLSVLSRVSPLDCTLVDLSQPMLERARERVAAATSGKVETVQADMRDLAFDENSFDTILAGAVLHHLRDDRDWREMFQRLASACGSANGKVKRRRRDGGNGAGAKRPSPNRRRKARRLFGIRNAARDERAFLRTEPARS
jgi:ubiquinone/menaquinone biosynthesis C-methylase UbiE